MTNIECFRGETKTWSLLVTQDTLPLDLTGASLRMDVRRNYVSDMLFQRTSALDGGITIDPDQTANKGKATVRLYQEDTLVLANQNTPLVYDIWVLTSGGDEWVVIYGQLLVKAAA